MLLLADLTGEEVERVLVVCVLANGKKLDNEDTLNSLDVGQKRRRESIS